MKFNQKFISATPNPYTLLEFELEESLEPSQLKGIQIPKIDTTKGVVLSGRGPIWLYAYLTHELHATAWVACNDPRLGAVVIETHTKGVGVGSVFQIQ
jgi:CRISPR-associated protein Csx3